MIQIVRQYIATCICNSVANASDSFKTVRKNYGIEKRQKSPQLSYMYKHRFQLHVMAALFQSVG